MDTDEIIEGGRGGDKWTSGGRAQRTIYYDSSSLTKITSTTESS